jgi:hypothetical protein
MAYVARKPTIIKAEQVTEEHKPYGVQRDDKGCYLLARFTIYGVDHGVKNGDWICSAADGLKYVVKEKEFNAKYYIVEDIKPR